MYSTKTIEDRIREKAQKELKDEIYRASKTLMDLACVGHTIPIKNDDPKSMGIVEAVAAVRERLYEHYRGGREEKAINTFLSKIDDLDAQLGELRAEVSGE